MAEAVTQLPLQAANHSGPWSQSRAAAGDCPGRPPLRLPLFQKPTSHRRWRCHVTTSTPVFLSPSAASKGSSQPHARTCEQERHNTPRSLFLEEPASFVKSTLASFFDPPSPSSDRPDRSGHQQHPTSSPALASLLPCSALALAALLLPSPAHALTLDASAVRDSVLSLAASIPSSLPFDPAMSAAALAASLPLEPALSSSDLSPLADAFSNPDFEGGLSASFLLVLFSEIGDKTFFIAALLAARRPALEVFTGTFGALGVMTFISVFLGRIFHVLDELLSLRLGDVAVPLDDVAAAVLLVYFGLQTLKDAAAMEDGAGAAGFEEEQEAAEVVATLRPYSLNPLKPPAADDASGAQASAAGDAPAEGGAMSLPMLASVFALVFLAEWGDKSFFSTIALAAASSPSGVIVGSVAAHALATVIAVLGGSLLSKVVSEKVIAYTGGTLFLVFAAGTVFQIVDKVALGS